MPFRNEIPKSNYAEAVRQHRQEVSDNVEKAANSSQYATYQSSVSALDKNVTVYAARILGRSHEDTHLPCQDSCDEASCSAYQILTAADGVSACDRSHLGSRFACDAAIETVKDICDNIQPFCEEKFVSALTDSEFRNQLLKCWLTKVKADIRKDNGNDDLQLSDLNRYGSTLMIVVMTVSSIVAVNLGDGQIILFNDYDYLFVRNHSPKEDSTTSALCNSDCRESRFLVRRYERKYYRGVLVSTDGIYDSLQNNSFYSYAKQIRDRFTEQHEPYRPFVFESHTSDGNRLIDVSRNISSDDCSIVLAIDKTPITNAVGKMYRDVLKVYPKILSLYDRNEYYSAYRVCDENGKAFLAVVQTKENYDKYAKIVSPAIVTQPVRTVGTTDYYITGYDCDNGGIFTTPLLFYTDGLLRQKDEIRYGCGSQSIIWSTYKLLGQIEKMLSEKNLYLNEYAESAIFIVGSNVILPLFAITDIPPKPGNRIRDRIFNGVIGKVTDTGSGFTRLLFSTGFITVGNSYLIAKDNTSKFFRVVQVENGYAVRNIGEIPWTVRTQDGEKVIGKGETFNLTGKTEVFLKDKDINKIFLFEGNE